MNSHLTFLQSRQSVAKLEGPAPSHEELREIFLAAARSPDHARIRPWRFIVLENEVRESLGSVFADIAVSSGENDAAKIEKLKLNPLRAPMIIVAVAKCVEHSKVPASEQQLSAACAAHNVLLAVDALGYGAIWRTGEMAYHPVVEDFLDVAANENIIGFLYVGTKISTAVVKNPVDINEFITYRG